DEYRAGLGGSLVDGRWEMAVEQGRPEPSSTDLEVFVPAVAADPRFRQWWQRAGNRGASPATAQALARTRFESDLRSALPAIQAPTLIIHRKDDRAALVGHGRYLAEHIAPAPYL